ncbi:MAG TPA: universal stress protein [Polyangia bacterium]|jgi:nucleotide-binding universal stress UspA family protein|nr:universal stress protein [Polyangia bacterium]
MPIQRILVALDGSPRAPAVRDAALELAQTTGAKLVLFRAVDIPIEWTQQMFSVSLEDLEQVLEQQARKDLHVLAQAVPSEQFAGVRVQIGAPWQSILSAAQVERADLIILGSHGHNLFERLVGTTASRVLQQAPCNVLLVRADLPETRSPPA